MAMFNTVKLWFRLQKQEVILSIKNIMLPLPVFLVALSGNVRGKCYDMCIAIDHNKNSDYSMILRHEWRHQWQKHKGYLHSGEWYFDKPEFKEGKRLLYYYSVHEMDARLYAEYGYTGMAKYLRKYTADVLSEKYKAGTLIEELKALWKKELAKAQSSIT